MFLAGGILFAAVLVGVPIWLHRMRAMPVKGRSSHRCASCAVTTCQPAVSRDCGTCC